ncbi:MAG: hypothetical protein R2873_27060 [Caldilineaceae bacterium]
MIGWMGSAVRDLLFAEELLPTVTVQTEDGGQLAGGARRFEEDSLGGCAGGVLPGEFFDVKPVQCVLFVDGGRGRRQFGCG